MYGYQRKMEKEDYIKKWLEGTLDEKEKALFERTEAYKSLQDLSNSLMSFKAPDYDMDAGYEALNARISAKKGRVVTMNWLSPLLKAAAVLLALAGSYFLFLHDPSTVIKTLAAEKTEIALPDSSFVALNALSRLAFNEKNWAKERRVELEGEAFFEVAKGSRFDVITSAGTISVLGTAFNVVNRTDYFEVICYEGSVKVESENKIVKLLPKQIFRKINDAGSTGTEKAANNLPDWRRGESSFESVPFRHVMQEFERQYHVSITTRNVDAEQLFTGTFTHSNLSLALKSIAIPLNLTYEVEGKKIILASDSK